MWRAGSPQADGGGGDSGGGGGVPLQHGASARNNAENGWAPLREAHRRLCRRVYVAHRLRVHGGSCVRTPAKQLHGCCKSLSTKRTINENPTAGFASDRKDLLPLAVLSIGLGLGQTFTEP